jgi:uncharacterized repeat protein (TIGR02543 family)
MERILGIRDVSFNTNGGNPQPQDQGLWRGERITKPLDPAKNGYSFSGWFTDNDTFRTPWDFNETDFDHMTLHARWNSVNNNICGECGEDPCICPPPEEYGITLSPGNIDFGTAAAGYVTQPPQEVTVTNTGTASTEQLSIVLSGTGANSFALSTTSLPALDIGKSNSFEVSVKNDLTAGAYTALLTVSNNTKVE